MKCMKQRQITSKQIWAFLIYCKNLLKLTVCNFWIITSRETFFSELIFHKTFMLYILNLVKITRKHHNPHPWGKNKENYNNLEYVYFQNYLPPLIRIRKTATIFPTYVKFYDQN